MGSGPGHLGPHRAQVHAQGDGTEPAPLGLEANVVHGKHLVADEADAVR